jgi:hypothetical protein
MLFARFLAGNGLLMYWPDEDDDPVDISLETCRELLDEGTESAGGMWELAARFAARMLPRIFRTGSPVFELALPPEHQQKLERLLEELPGEVFTASDALGWVYQFWQSGKKEEINDSGVKIGARELPAVTQLFTEPYMVAFLLDNSIGAWWAARRLSGADLKSAESEEELRSKAALPGVPLSYLRFVRTDDGWTPAAGTFGRWPESLRNFAVLDPCCGSGHFLVALLSMLVSMRIDLEGLSPREAVDAVLRENLHALDIDRRVTEIAAFALALAAWTYDGAGGYRPLPELNIACSGLAVSAAKEEWGAMGMGRRNMTLALEWLHDVFRDAPAFGSLLDPSKSDSAKLVRWSELSGTLDKALAQEQTDERREAAVAAQGISKAATLLARKYHLVITNVPYLGRGKQDDRLRAFCDERFPASKNELATVFLERCMDLCAEGGTSSLVMPQNWLFLTTYKKLREKMLKEHEWRLIARMGAGAFETITGEIVKATLIVMSRGNAATLHDGLFATGESSGLMRGVDVSEARSAAGKDALLPTAEIRSVVQATQLENPAYMVRLDHDTVFTLFRNYIICYQGTSTGDNPQFVFSFWEFDVLQKTYSLFEGVSNETRHFGGKSFVSRWDDVVDFEGSAFRGSEAYKKRGVAIGQMRYLPATLYLGSVFPNSLPVIIPKDPIYLKSVWVFCESHEFADTLRGFNQKLSVDNGYVGKIPFDFMYWTEVAEREYPNGLPEPYTDDPTQWIFHGHPCGSVVWDEEEKRTVRGPLRIEANVLQIAVARLLGYRWPAELDEAMELADEQREWATRCGALLPFADRYGIVCIPPLLGEPSAADRLLNLLVAAYGREWSNDTLSLLLTSAGHAGKTLESWLREKFFAQHCKLFQNRPFVWHIWDGLRDGFAALVNYHTLDYKALETLIYTSLGGWIAARQQDAANGVDGALERIAAAEGLKKRLELILEGEAPYDVFVRWKAPEEQPVGWNPELNDGVRLNIRPFMSVPDVGKRGAGVLREKPGIHWNKDRGMDVGSSPWFPLFKGDRINDHHLTLAEKTEARRFAAKGAPR